MPSRNWTMYFRIWTFFFAKKSLKEKLQTLMNLISQLVLMTGGQRLLFKQEKVMLMLVS
jgi:hypothetical protein